MGVVRIAYYVVRIAYSVVRIAWCVSENSRHGEPI